MKRRNVSDSATGSVRSVERLAAKLFAEADPRKAQFVAAIEKSDGAQPVVLQLHAAKVADLGSDTDFVEHARTFERGGSDALPSSQKHPSDTIRPDWLPEWARIVPECESPGKAPEHESGDWYVLDLSSVFCASPLLMLSQNMRAALDLCASPGGKACFLWRAIRPALLVANEPIQGRIRALISNIKRCRINPCVITKRDPARLVQEMPQQFDLVFVDAPCSGQSLRVKGKPAAGAFHPSTINMNLRRQRRILAAASDLVRPGGAIVYSTCTYAEEENESNVVWFLSKFSEFRAHEVPALRSYQSHLSDIPCYRLWPFQGQGAGGFTCLLQHQGVATECAAPAQLPHIEWSSAQGTRELQKLIEV